jgi:hypothetical protein
MTGGRSEGNFVDREKMKNPQFRVSLIVAVALALLASIIAVIVVSTLELTTATAAVGPGYYPLLLCILMFVSCLYVIYSLLYGDSDRIVFKAVLDRDAVDKPLALLVLAVVSVATMPLFGFLGSMFLFNLIQLSYLEKEKQPFLWRIIYSAAISGGIFWLFRALMIYLPVPFWL